jgi:hypothetical protein
MSAGPREQTTEAARKHREELNEEGVCICGWHANVEMDYPAAPRRRVVAGSRTHRRVDVVVA